MTTAVVANMTAVMLLALMAISIDSGWAYPSMRPPSGASFAYPKGDDNDTPGPLANERILCPVLAALHRSGDLVVDSYGDATYEQIYDALHDGLWCSKELSDFQATGISDYNQEHKIDEKHRDRCIQGTPCWIEKQIRGVTNRTRRWLNIFRMNGHQAVEHGISTGVRGGGTNMPEEVDPCAGVYPCEHRFQQFYVSSADKNGRLYLQNLKDVICKARLYGDRGGEFSYNPGVATYLGGDAREWQMKAAFAGFITGFGRTDENGELYIDIDDARAMFMHGRLPDGWKKRNWGCLASGCLYPFFEAIAWDLPDCPSETWWGGTECESDTGVACKISCKGGATCISGRCVCARGPDGLAMCARNGTCISRQKQCSYFGGPCDLIPADNPSAPW